MPFYRCMNPSGSSGGDSYCDHITINYNGYESPYTVDVYNNIPTLLNNALGDSSVFNSDVIIGSGVVNTNELFSRCSMFNANVDMSNANRLATVPWMFFGCFNLNRPIVFPTNNIYSYYATFRACLNYDQPTELFINTGNNTSLFVNLSSVFMQCSNFNSQVKLNFLTNTFRFCQYDYMFYNADSYNQPTILKYLGSFNGVFLNAAKMSAPIVVDLERLATNAAIGNNALYVSNITEIIVLNYVNQAIKWDGGRPNITYYVNDPNTFVNRCTYLYRSGGAQFNYLPCDNGLIANVSYYNIRVLYNVDDACNRFNNLYYERFGEYPEY